MITFAKASESTKGTPMGMQLDPGFPTRKLS